MKNKRIKIFFICLMLIFSVGMLGILLMINGADKIKEADTVSLPVTIQHIESDNSAGTGDFIIIDTYEYIDLFRVPIEFSDRLQSIGLKPGKKGYLTIQKDDEKQLNEAFFVNVVGLSCDDEVLVSIDEYNRCVHKSIAPTRIAAIATAVGLLTGAALIIRSLVKDKTTPHKL